MKTGIKLFIATVSFTTLCAWSANQANSIKDAEWLIGTWENSTTRGSIYETWSKTNVKMFSGKSYAIKEKDTLVFETIQLVWEQNSLYYIPTVKNQNGGLPVRFASKKISDTQLVFENLQHDFPQVISYSKMGSDSLVAEILGTKNGQERKQRFAMKRVK